MVNGERKILRKEGEEGVSHIYPRIGRDKGRTQHSKGNKGRLCGDGTHTYIYTHTHMHIPGEAIFFAVAASSLLYFSRDMRMLKASTVAKAATRAPMVMKRRAMLY